MKSFVLFVVTSLFALVVANGMAHAAETKRTFFHGVNFPRATFGKVPGALIRVVAQTPNITRIDERDLVLQEFVSDAWESMNLFIPESPNDQ
jgi:hypothetical protein